MGTRTGATTRVCAAALATLMLTGCGILGIRAERPPGACPDGRSGNAEINWVPFVVVNDVMLSTVHAPEYELRQDQIGAVVTTVTCRIAEVVRDPDFKPRHGDAAYLPVGTPIHSVVGFPATSRVAARQDGVWRYYRSVEASPSP